MLILFKILANVQPPTGLVLLIGLSALLGSAILFYFIVRLGEKQICFKCRKQIGETKWCKDCAEWRFEDARRRGAFEGFDGDLE